MKSKKGIDIVTSVGTRLYDAFVNASTSGMKRVVTTVGTGAGQNQMAMQNDTMIVDAISASGGGFLLRRRLMPLFRNYFGKVLHRLRQMLTGYLIAEPLQ